MAGYTKMVYLQTVTQVLTGPNVD